MSHRLEIEYHDQNRTAGRVSVKKLPDGCSQCHHHIDPIRGSAYLNTKKKTLFSLRSRRSIITHTPCELLN